MPGNPLTNPDWAPNLANTIERVVGGVRDKTTKPALLVYRGLVYGVIALFGGLTSLVLGLVFMTRALQAVLDWPFAHTTSVWVSYLFVGGLFTVVGLILMTKRHPKKTPA
jgi:hypothetical protein